MVPGTQTINMVINWGLNDADCTLNNMPLFHTGGINALSLPILLVGGTVVIGQKFDPERAIRALDEYKTTISLFVPTMYQLMTPLLKHMVYNRFFTCSKKKLVVVHHVN